MVFFKKKSSKNKAELPTKVSAKILPPSLMKAAPVKRHSIFQEAMEMTAGAMVIYIFADIRELAREGKIDIPLKDMQAPLSAGQLLGIIQANKNALQERAIDDEEVENLLKALKQMQVHNAHQEGRDDSSMDIWSAGLNQLFRMSGTAFGRRDSSNKAKSAVMTHFEDGNAKKEIVHSIIVNQDRKRITVVFRGSSTPKDFIQDAKVAQQKIENPVFKMMGEDNEGMPETINLHTGFYKYLLKLNKTTKKTRIQSILDDVKQQLRANPNFQLYITGHSLGGALSTMFGFFAATDDEICQLSPKGVIVYSVASPFVGNWKFRFAFQELERRKRLQHLRIANAEDMVTLMPFAVPKVGFFVPPVAAVTGAGNLYKHVGMRLQLTETCKNGAPLPYSISYPVDQRMDDEEFAKEVQDTLSAGKNLVKAFKAVATNDFKRVERHHSCNEYEERLQKCKGGLTSYTLDDLYSNKSIVGNMMDPNYRPTKGKVVDNTVRAVKVMKKGQKSSSSEVAAH